MSLSKRKIDLTSLSTDEIATIDLKKVSGSQLRELINITRSRPERHLAEKPWFQIFRLPILKRYNELGGEAFFGPLEKDDFSERYYKNGCLCYNTNLKQVFVIAGAIYEHWKNLGGIKWGVPNTDELPCSDTIGRFNHFNGDTASIYWSPETGAQGIWGAIRARWAELGYERSYLGYPTSDEVNFPDDGRVNSFQHGGIYYWSDTGAIDINDVVVHYTGLACFGETDELSASDEPYVTIGVMTPFGSASVRSQIYEYVDKDETRTDLIELYRGKPNGIILGVRLMENDEGDPNKYKDDITAAFQAAHAAGTAALGLIPVVGPGIAAVAGPLIQKFVPKIGQEINDLFGTGDDEIGYQVITLTGKEMLRLATLPANLTMKDIGYRFSTNNMTGDGATYRVFFGIVSA